MGSTSWIGIMCVNLGRYTLILYLVHSVRSQGPFQLTLSSNPVYSGDSVTLTVSYGSGLLVQVTVDAFNATHKKGSLSYVSSPLISNGTGVFDGQTFTGWQTQTPLATNISVTLTATPSFELDYNCTIKVLYGGSIYDGTCEFSSLKVFVCPSVPSFQPSPVIFSDSDNGIIMCESRNGKPAALVSLTASDIRGARWASGNFSDAANLTLPSPLPNWHNAALTCRVTNHNCANMSVTAPVIFKFNTSVPGAVCTNESNVVLNCSTHIWSYPSFVYKWTIPAEANVSGGLDLESLTVPQGQSGSFKCTATNNYSMASVDIVFTVSNVCHPITPPSASPAPSTCELCWIIGLVLGIVVVIIIAVVLCVLCKRGHFSKGTNKSGVVTSGTDQRSDNGSNRGSLLYVYDGPTSRKSSTERDSDAHAFHLVDRHTLAAGEVASRKGLAPSTSDAPVQDRHYMEDIRKPTRLLIAAEGVVSQLSQRTLHTTAVVEFSDRTCTLNDILEKVEKEVPRSSPKFKSVALLLRPAKVGVILSEVDQADLNSSRIQKEQGEKVRSFMTRLAQICLDERGGGTRLDVLNYCSGKAPMRLSEALTNLLGIPTTVSKDQFGVETPTGEEGGHAVVVDAYFERDNLGELVFAELQQPSVKPQVYENAHPRQPDDRVIYSEVKR